jgi:hypothetical protein
LVACALLAAGCGGQRAATEPALPRVVAERLQALAPRPAALRAAAIREVNAGRVPAELQEELLARANAYAERPTDSNRRSVEELLR